jgi:hypothetical protein
MSWWLMQLDHGSGLLVGELASLWRCLLLDGGLWSTSSRLLPLPTSAALLEREADIQPRRRHLRWNWHHGLCG